MGRNPHGRGMKILAKTVVERRIAKQSKDTVLPRVAVRLPILDLNRSQLWSDAAAAARPLRPAFAWLPILIDADSGTARQHPAVQRGRHQAGRPGSSDLIESSSR